MDSVQFKKYYTTVKNFLLGPKNKEFLIFLFFFFVSAAFWLLQSLNETFDVELKVPLKLENVPSDVVITSDLPSDLNVMVRDKGTVLVRYIYGTEQVPVRVDYKDYDKGNASGRCFRYAFGCPEESTGAVVVFHSYCVFKTGYAGVFF